MSRAPSLKEGKKDTVDCEASFPYWRIVPREENRDKLATVVSSYRGDPRVCSPGKYWFKSLYKTEECIWKIQMKCSVDHIHY